MKVIRCTIGVSNGYQELALSRFLFAIVKDRLRDEKTKISLHGLIFADDIVIFNES